MAPMCVDISSGVDIATFLSVLSTVPRHCARLTYFLHRESRRLNAVLVALKLSTLTLRRLWRAVSAPKATTKKKAEGDIRTESQVHEHANSKA